MQPLSTHLLLLCLLPVLAAAAPTPQSSPPPLGFTPGLSIPAECRNNPSLNQCPARLSSGNALVTSTNVVINDVQGSEPRYPNILYAGFSPLPRSSELSEAATIAIFEFPAGMVGKQCRFQLVSDSGDNAGGRPNVYNVWAYPGGSATPTAETTWFSKPPRDRVVATFLLDEAKAAATTSNRRFLHSFLWGPGEGSSDGTFKCPPAGRVAFEVASAVKAECSGGGMNIGGQSGLGIEILGVESEWW